MSKVKYFCIFPTAGTSGIWDQNGNSIEPDELPFVLDRAVINVITALNDAYLWFMNSSVGEYVKEDTFTPFIYDVYRNIQYYHPEEYTEFVKIPWFIPNKRVWRGPDCKIFPRTTIN